jgi:hypothetical protein
VGPENIEPVCQAPRTAQSSMTARDRVTRSAQILRQIHLYLDRRFIRRGLAGAFDVSLDSAGMNPTTSHRWPILT